MRCLITTVHSRFTKKKKTWNSHCKETCQSYDSIDMICCNVKRTTEYQKWLNKFWNIWKMYVPHLYNTLSIHSAIMRGTQKNFCIKMALRSISSEFRFDQIENAIAFDRIKPSLFVALASWLTIFCAWRPLFILLFIGLKHILQHSKFNSMIQSFGKMTSSASQDETK